MVGAGRWGGPLWPPFTIYHNAGCIASKKGIKIREQGMFKVFIFSY